MADGAQVFADGSHGRGAVGCVAVITAPFAFFIALDYWRESLVAVVLSVAAELVLLVGAYLFFSEEHVVTIDERSLRYTRARLLFGRRGPAHVVWELPIEQLTRACEVTTKTPSSKGGWSTSTKLVVAGKHELDDFSLGGSGPRTAYSALVRALQERLGAAFERSERLSS